MGPQISLTMVAALVLTRCLEGAHYVAEIILGTSARHSLQPPWMSAGKWSRLERSVLPALKRGHQPRQCHQSSKYGVDSFGKGHRYLLHASTPRKGQEPREPLIVELPPENTGVRCGIAVENLTDSSKVALKSVSV